MRYIKRCENCLREVRFPLDKGILLVTCPYCKHTFLIDPNEISTYKDGRFDLTPLQSLENSSSLYTSRKENLKKTIVFLLFFLLFLNLFKSFGGFSSQSSPKEEQHYKHPSPQESEPKNEDLEFI